jgi:hypothetical protein
MKRLLFVLPALCLLFLLPLVGHADARYDLKVGVAQASVTPGDAAFIAGGRNNRRFTGVHDSLYVKVIAVSDARNHIVMVSFDCIGMLYTTLVEIRKEIASQLPASAFNPGHIVMNSTHTHSGPDVVGIWGPDQMTSGVDSAYMRRVVTTTVNTIVQAWKNRQDATMVYAETEFGQDWVYNISDSLNLDRSLSVLQFLDRNGKSIGTLTNFACHPTILDGANSLVSSDYPGAMYQQLDQQLGGTNIFLNGSIGGWVQPEYEPKTFESVNRRGGELAAAVLNALKQPKTMSHSAIEYRSIVFNLPVSNPGFRQLAAAGVIDRAMTDSVETELAFFSLGEAQFVTHPGETSPTYAKASKKKMKNNGPRFVIGLGMDALGYILTPEFYVPGTQMKHAGYLTSMSVDKQAGEIIMQKIDLLTR